MEAALVATLRELYAKSKTPSHDDKESAAQAIGHIIEQAQAIGCTHAAYGHAETRSIAWGGKFTDALQSGWSIVMSFVQRIGEWIQAQVNPTPEEIQAEIDTVAGHAGDFEVHAAIESEVLQELTFAGVKKVVSVAEPDCCDDCAARAAADPVPIDDFEPPPYHGKCRCHTAPADEEDQ